MWVDGPEMIANHTGQSMAAIGYYRLRPPVKPITLAELASLEVHMATVNDVTVKC